jgi:DNA-binding MarR family transcriptional regulator
MAQTIADLQADGMVGRRPDPIDRRCILIELTEHGRDTLREDRRRREGWLAEAIATQLSDEEQRTLNDAVPLLQRLTQS